jgi:UDP:flavonoid glycosyltransferase YjiC (YdhE family)
MHLIVSGFGSYGDVLPMVGLGAAMHARGHRVQVIANPYFRPVVEEAGLELLPLGSAQEYLELASHPDLWHPRRGLKLVLSRGAAAYLRATYDLLEANFRGGETVLAAHGLDLASRVFHDKHAAPLASVHFAPFAMYTLHDTPHYLGAPFVRMSPRWLKWLTYYAVDKAIVDPLIAPAINALRSDLGLKPVSRIFTGWNQSPQLVLGLWPEWFGPRQPDFPPQMELVGFPLYDGPRSAPLAGDVQEFLQAGAPPIVFAPGSANTQADGFFRTAVAACEQLGRRGMLATKYADQLPAGLPASVKHVSFAPFSKLLPRAAALVHHGGIGTCAQGLASGLPQVVMPMAYDQLDNGKRLERLGVAEIVRPRQFKPGRVASALRRLLEAPETAERAQQVAAQCDGAANLARASELLEGLLAASRAGRSAMRPAARMAGGVVQR